MLNCYSFSKNNTGSISITLLIVTTLSNTYSARKMALLAIKNMFFAVLITTFGLFLYVNF